MKNVPKISDDLIDDFVSVTQRLIDIPTNETQVKQNIFRLGGLLKDAQNQSNARACNCKGNTQINN